MVNHPIRGKTDDEFDRRPGPQSAAPAAPYSGPSYMPALVVLTSLFFMWGLITSLNDILIPHLKAIFTLSYRAGLADSVLFFRRLLRDVAALGLPGGEAGLSPRHHHRAVDRRRRVPGLLSRGLAAVLSVVPRRSVRAGFGHHVVTSGRESVCVGARPADDGGESPESHPSIQFAGHDGRPVSRLGVHFDGGHRRSAVDKAKEIADGAGAVPDSRRPVVRDRRHVLAVQIAGRQRHGRDHRGRRRSQRAERLETFAPGARRGRDLHVRRRRSRHRQLPGEFHGAA